MTQSETQQEKTTQDTITYQDTMTYQQKLEIAKQVLQVLEQVPDKAGNISPGQMREYRTYEILRVVVALAFPAPYYRFRLLRIE